ncbi:Eukaryotic translation initiation factor 3 subunit H [Malassezia restricta CBS 7877]|uniref:Eukaryotic translation initiation factor 3 subunit H n=1 Tax=Malassezia restricta (strain ATCC 96810 / NBRC 103918 / CBS 7877) TaxID=425264 RepID=A0A3G2S3G2_MALR7|nr:Eukaryotic translation initiation factor 3 subunit H [Malassezia restricta CBS 7877]
MSRTESAAAVARGEDVREDTQNVETSVFTEDDQQILDLDSEVITNVHLDGMALMKMIKHCKDNHAVNGSNAWGALLGMDMGGTLEVSNVFGLPGMRAERGDEDERTTKSSMQYMAEMLRLLHQVNADVSPVGLYQGSFLGPFLNTAIVDGLNTLSLLMEREGQRGRGKAVMLVHDYAQLAQGNLVLKAYRLSPSFIDAYRKGKFSAQHLIEHRLTFSNVLIEIPVHVRNTALMDAMLSTLTTENVPESRIAPRTSKELLTHPIDMQVAPDNMDLNLALEPVLVSTLESTLDAAEAYASESGNVGYQARQIAREKARADAFLTRRKAENATRESAGLAPLPLDEVNKLFKIPAEPNRLESLLLLNQLDSAAQRLTETATIGTVQLNAARTGTA